MVYYKVIYIYNIFKNILKIIFGTINYNSELC
jgi:hypothetical protein